MAVHLKCIELSIYKVPMINKHVSILIVSLALMACQSAVNLKIDQQIPKNFDTPSSIIAAAIKNDWRDLDGENTLYLNLTRGTVVIELLPDLAPNHVSNTKSLIRQGIFDGSQFYRVLDGFVAQGGPEIESADDRQPLTEGAYSIAQELTYQGPLPEQYIAFDWSDPYADETGFIKGFAVGRDAGSKELWQLHCYGALGMGRTNDLNSGGTELYIVNGPAQRYLDRNVTVFGRVVAGMEHIQALKRSAGLNGPVDLTGYNIIESIQVAADMADTELIDIQIMKTESVTFKKLLAARKNRAGEWFVHQHNYISACGVPVPVRIKPTSD